jgi:hypothetical protein
VSARVHTMRRQPSSYTADATCGTAQSRDNVMA